MTTTTRSEAILQTFKGFRSEIDSHYATRERLIKLSRDITDLSKKLIFTLHRVNTQPREVVLQEASIKFDQLNALFLKVQSELTASQGGFWRYENAVSPGIQEYLEALTFHAYIMTATLPSLLSVQATLSNEAGPLVIITPQDYLGGISDLTGELMRLAIGMAGSSLGSDGLGIREVSSFVRQLKSGIDPLARSSKWLPKKLVVLDQSLGKIESTSYALAIRFAEYKDSPEMLEAFQNRLARGEVALDIET